MTAERSAATEYLPGVYESRPRATHACRGLFAATEGFGVPLWDLRWEISNADKPAAIGRARRFARRLLSRGWAVMVVEPWATSNEERDVPFDEALAVLSRGEPWEPSQEMFSLVATDSGQGLYRMHSLRRPLHRVGFNY